MRIALTFDTEPAPAHCRPDGAERLLDALAEAGAAATFFVQGQWAELSPRLAARLAEEGHAVGNHTYSHTLLRGAPSGVIREEVRRGQEAIIENAGVDPRPLFRCPWGVGGDDPRVLQEIEPLGYRHVGWSFDSFDWQVSATAEDVVKTVLRGCDAAGDGCIALLHSWPDATADALPVILRRLREMGAELVSLGPNP